MQERDIRASEGKAMGDDYEKGRRAGDEWAEDADPIELERLDAFREGVRQAVPSGRFEDWLRGEVSPAFNHAQRIAMAAISWSEKTHYEAAIGVAVRAMFGQNGERGPVEWLDGFVTGACDALQVWKIIAAVDAVDAE